MSHEETGYLDVPSSVSVPIRTDMREHSHTPTLCDNRFWPTSIRITNCMTCEIHSTTEYHASPCNNPCKLSRLVTSKYRGATTFIIGFNADSMDLPNLKETITTSIKHHNTSSFFVEHPQKHLPSNTFSHLELHLPIQMCELVFSLMALPLVAPYGVHLAGWSQAPYVYQPVAPFQASSTNEYCWPVTMKITITKAIIIIYPGSAIIFNQLEWPLFTVSLFALIHHY